MTDVTAQPAAQPAGKPAPKTIAGVDTAAVADRAKAIAGDVSAKAQDTYDQVRRAMSDHAETARDWAADQSDVLRDTVQTKPFIAVGVSAASAFAAGLVLGVILARR